MLSTCTFLENSASKGGAIWAGFASLTCFNSRFDGNTSGTSPAAGIGGALYLGGGSALIANCVFWQNRSNNPAGGYGGTAYIVNQSATFSNCSFSPDVPSGGSAAANGEVLYIVSSPQYPSTCTVVNSIVWDAFNPANIFGGRVGVTYSSIQGGHAGVGNINADPLWTVGTLSLTQPTPVIDAGCNASVVSDALDLDGDGNLVEPTPIDIVGAPRFNQTLAVPDTGCGPAPVVDMGAFESPLP